MPTLEEMTVWTPDDIEAEIRQILPKGLSFECGFDKEAGTWFTHFWHMQNGQKVTDYQDWGWEQRITYFNAYGWVWVRMTPPPSAGSPWVRRREAVPVPPSKVPQTPDPADLDPNEIRAVYAHQARTKKP